MLVSLQELLSMKQLPKESRGIMKYRDYNDYELLSYIAEQNEDAEEILYEKYKPIIVSFAKKVFPYVANTGLELNDLVQEGMLGLNQAMKYYDDHKENSFYTFAKTCIERKILTLVTTQRRQKHRILNESLSIDTANPEKTYGMEAFLKDTSTDPEVVLISKEREEQLIEKVHQVLTNFEDEVFTLRMNQFSYQEISAILDKDKKSIDNALQRIRIKIKKILDELNQE